jgi:negative elongation factor B
MPKSSSSTVKVGLEAIGLQNNQHLKNSLINCDDPLKAISDFQEENSIQLPTLKPALNLLDLHNIKRLDFHLSIADELKDNLSKRVEELASQTKDATLKENNNVALKKLEDLLDKMFPLIK